MAVPCSAARHSQSGAVHRFGCRQMQIDVQPPPFAGRVCRCQVCLAACSRLGQSILSRRSLMRHDSRCRHSTLVAALECLVVVAVWRTSHRAALIVQLYEFFRGFDVIARPVHWSSSSSPLAVEMLRAAWRSVSEANALCPQLHSLRPSLYQRDLPCDVEQFVWWLYGPSPSAVLLGLTISALRRLDYWVLGGAGAGVSGRPR